MLCKSPALSKVDPCILHGDENRMMLGNNWERPRLAEVGLSATGRACVSDKSVSNVSVKGECKGEEGEGSYLIEFQWALADRKEREPVQSYSSIGLLLGWRSQLCKCLVILVR